MARKRKQSGGEEGAPAWMVTYGDMMSLLLCFFVMLVSLSEIKTEKFFRVLESIRRALGYTAAAAPLPGGESPGNSPHAKISYFEFIRGKHMNQSESDQRGPVGPHHRVSMLRDGPRSVVGGRVHFARGSAELPDQARDGLGEMADLLRGHPNKIEVRGHASRQPLPAGSPFRDKWALAYARGRAVAEALVTNDISPERIRIVSCADGEPLQETYETGQRWRNRRVEVLMMEATADQFVQPTAPDRLSRRPRGGSDRG